MDSSHVPSCIDRMSLYSKELPLSQLRTREEAKKQQMIIYNRLRENNHEVPPYELQNYIGKGSYGRVYVAWVSFRELFIDSPLLADWTDFTSSKQYPTFHLLILI